MATPYRGKLYWFSAIRSGPATRSASSRLRGRLPAAGQGRAGPRQGHRPDVLDGCRRVQPAHAAAARLRRAGLGGGVFTLKDAGGRSLYTHFTHLDGRRQGGGAGAGGLRRRQGLFSAGLRYAWTRRCTLTGSRSMRRERAAVPLLPVEDAQAVPLVRVRADTAHVTDPHATRAFTCLRPARVDGRGHELDRAAGRATDLRLEGGHAALGNEQQQALIRRGS